MISVVMYCIILMLNTCKYFYVLFFVSCHSVDSSFCLVCASFYYDHVNLSTMFFFLFHICYIFPLHCSASAYQNFPFPLDHLRFHLSNLFQQKQYFAAVCMLMCVLER